MHRIAEARADTMSIESPKPCERPVASSDLLDGWLQSRNGKTLHWCCGGRALCGCKNSRLGWRAPHATAKCKECEWRLRGVAEGLLDRIQNYLGNGGLFNPEMMEHEKVRDLIMDCRDYIAGTKPSNRQLLVGIPSHK